MPQPTFDFSTVLASSVHDMKNSLCLLIQTIEDVSEQVADSSATEKLAKVHYEAQRMNSALVQMLTLYRDNQGALPLHIDQHPLDELIDELLLNNTLYFEQRSITIDTDIDDDILCWFDRDLIFQVLNDIIINAMRYTADTLFITVARTSHGECCIEVHERNAKKGFIELRNNGHLGGGVFALTLP